MTAVIYSIGIFIYQSIRKGNIMSKKDFTVTSKILMSLLAAGDMFLVTPRELRRRLLLGQILGDGKNFAQFVHYLAKKGFINYVDKNNERFIKLTQKGQLEALLAKARLPPEYKADWDGRWRLIIFDIPEESRDKRNLFRELLKRNSFVKLQASVFISPYALNREAIIYLRQSGLMKYIRILLIQEMDDDGDLRKKFNLKKQ